MRFAVSIPPFADAATLVEMAVDAEQAGWDAVWLWDHLQFIPAMGVDVHDPWTVLGAMAVKTERVLLGTCVTPLARRRPWIVAKQLVTLDHLSHGRAMLGVGLGEPPGADFEAFGEPGDARERAVLLDDGLELLVALLSGEAVDHHGPRFRVSARLRPPPVQRPRPRIFVAAVAPHRRPLARALRFDGVFPIGAANVLSADELAAYLHGIERPAGWDVMGALMPGSPVADFERVGATWLAEGAWPSDDWLADLRDRIRRGPPV